MPNVDRILTLHRAARYSNPQDPSAIIPRGFGNFLDPTAVPTEVTSSGFIKAVCINQFDLVYAINDGPVANLPPDIFWNGVLQPDPYPTVAVFNPSNNFEGHGLIATLQFSLFYVMSGVVSVRHGGSVDGQGTVITNPLRGLMAMFFEYLGWTIGDFDLGTIMQTIRDMDTLGYPFYAVFQEEKSVREWLMEILPQYHTDAVETGNGQLAIILDRSLTTLPIVPDYHILAHEIKYDGSPAKAIRTETQIDNLANQITLHLRHNWDAGQSSYTFVGDYEQSQAAYHTAYPIDFTFRHMYTPAHITQWLTSFVTRHGFEPRVVRLTMHGLKGTVLIPPRLITVEWPPWGWQQRLLKIRTRTTSHERREVVFECIDCWRELSDTVIEPSTSLVQRRDQINRVYQWIPGTVGDQGVLEDAPGPSRNEAANGDFELGDNGQWRLRDTGGNPKWVLISDSTKAHVGRIYARSMPARTDYLVSTMRRRIDRGEWVMVSGVFCDDATGASGFAHTLVVFYDLDGQTLGFATGNYVPPTANYLESILLAEAPVGAYHFVPGFMLFLEAPLVGTWRADKIVANSGSRAELLTKRLQDLGSGNLIINGNFDAGPISWDWQNAAAVGWYFDGSFPLSPNFHATHTADASPNIERRLYNLTRILLTPGQPIHVQGWWRTINSPNGRVRFGLQFFSSTSQSIGEVATPILNGPWEGAYVWWGQTFTVPANAYYGILWADVFSHTTPGTFWFLDDVVCVML